MLLEMFEKHRVRYALIGGWALASVGYVRATQDIDFLLHHEDYPRVKAALDGFGYALLHESEDAANFVGKMGELGQVDFLMAHRPYALRMLERAMRKPVLGGKFHIPVLRTEDLIGLKLQSLVNDEERYHNDLQDIEALIALDPQAIHWGIIKEYCQLLDKNHEYESLCRKFLDAH